jgi:ribosomal small subunit protein bTHX
MKDGDGVYRSSIRDYASRFLPSPGEPMGKGDKRTRRGKLFRGSHGKSRSKKNNKPVKKPF